MGSDDANVTARRVTPRSRCAAVRNTREEISVPEDAAQVLSEHACGREQRADLGVLES
jgi:hypothetical protein